LLGVIRAHRPVTRAGMISRNFPITERNGGMPAFAVLRILAPLTANDGETAVRKWNALTHSGSAKHGPEC
jgi:hypothetical protein